MALAELSAKFKFSICLKASIEVFPGFTLFIDRSSIVSAMALLISLHSKIPKNYFIWGREFFFLTVFDFFEQVFIF